LKVECRVGKGNVLKPHARSRPKRFRSNSPTLPPPQIRGGRGWPGGRPAPTHLSSQLQNRDTNGSVRIAPSPWGLWPGGRPNPTHISSQLQDRELKNSVRIISRGPWAGGRPTPAAWPPRATRPTGGTAPRPPGGRPAGPGGRLKARKRWQRHFRGETRLLPK